MSPRHTFSSLPAKGAYLQRARASVMGSSGRRWFETERGPTNNRTRLHLSFRQVQTHKGAFSVRRAGKVQAEQHVHRHQRCCVAACVVVGFDLYLLCLGTQRQQQTRLDKPNRTHANMHNNVSEWQRTRECYLYGVRRRSASLNDHRSLCVPREHPRACV